MSSPRRAIISFNFSNLDLSECEIFTNPLTSESRSRQGGALNAERLAPFEAVVPGLLSTAGVGLGGQTSDKVPIVSVVVLLLLFLASTTNICLAETPVNTQMATILCHPTISQLMILSKIA
ncbi:hypothetical protein NPIL_500281 [Nephila pilipes]|uniref:Uncharacterized protein n=1 Tax=Nephila pilipes TaxID=299642 RepID=A0A8X6PG95_NEPPI|nr:hypothetical protein NPIL_500281 [Nephila pilipes]